MLCILPTSKFSSEVKASHGTIASLPSSNKLRREGIVELTGSHLSEVLFFIYIGQHRV
jgi:hypothetical protein